MRPFVLLAAAGLVAIAAFGQAPPAASQATADGAAIYKRCAACHLANGAGVPGAFPPLREDVRKLAGNQAGRRYLALVVIKGVSGPIVVEGKTYRGMMPAQSGLNDMQVSAVLNHVIKGGTAKPFTPAEVAQHRASGTGLNSAAVGKLNPGNAGK